MRFLRSLTRVIVPAALLFASSALGATDEVAETGAVALPHGGPVRIGNMERQAALEASTPWQSFRKRNGDWSALWNEVTGTPHRAFGQPIRLPGFRDDAASVDAAVRQFVHANAAVFGVDPVLETASVQRSDRMWYVRYRQTVNGIPVLFSDWDFRVGVNGQLAMFGADAHPNTIARSSAAMVGTVAREAAKTGLAFDPSADRVEGAQQLYLLPYPKNGGLEYRLVYEVTVRTQKPLGNWLTYVDANTGEVLYRQNRVREAISGNVAALVQPLLPTDVAVSRPLPHLGVTVGAATVFTDAAGNYSGAASGTSIVSAQLRGQFCDVNRQDAGDASFSTSAANGSTVNITWGSNAAADPAERDVYYHVNLVHDYIKGIDSTPIGLDNPMPCAVNVNDVCNAFWDGTGLNFFAAGGGCVNTGTMADVIYHEYGHAINDYTYIAHGAPGGMSNGALHEGLADVNAALLTDDPVIGDGFTGPGTNLRTISNTNHWPENASGDPHTTGLIVGGACWDLRQSVGLTIARHDFQFAKWGVPDDPNDGVAFSEYFVDMLVADDDDANLANGTPHGSQIIAAFNAHGIGTNFFLHVTHTPVTDQFIPVGSVPVKATFTYTGPIGAFNTGSPTLHYQVNKGSFVNVTMTPTGNPNEYSANIPVTQMNVYHYYLTGADNQGGTIVSPAGAPATPINAFFDGGAIVSVDEQMESNPGWTIGAAGDAATTGIWVRTDPVASLNGSILVQPEEDHTPGSGVQCFVTGNALAGDPPGTNDVDGGATTLTTKTMGLPGGFGHPVIDYYRWFSNDQGGAPGTDPWRVDISNNGGTSWVPVESTFVSHNDWARVLFRIEDYVTPTNNLQLRFVARDDGAGSVIEAAVDDFRLLGFNIIDAVPGPVMVADAKLSLAPAAPNPFQPSTRFAYTLPVEAPVRLSVYDVRGRLVRELMNGVEKAGEHSLRWDGLDRAGHQVPSGPYFVRLSQGGKEITKTVVRLK